MRGWRVGLFGFDSSDQVFRARRAHGAVAWNDPDLPWIGVFFGGVWLANIFYWGCNQFITQRTLAARSVPRAIRQDHRNGVFHTPYGLPLTLYGDRLSLFQRNDRHWTLAEELRGTRRELGRVLEAEVAVDYFTLRALDAQYQILQETVVAYRRSLELTRNRRKGGIATELDVSQAETQLASTEAQIPAVQLQRANFLHALAVLCGQVAPSFGVSVTQDALAAARRSFEAGPGIPVSVPSELLERRPDIAGAERLMAAANADVGVAYAAFYPKVMLNGLAGFQSIDASTLFNWQSRFWAVGPSLSLPLFTGGRNRAQLAAARAAYDAAVANYRQTVLSAFQDVEDQLTAQRLLAQQLEKESVALKSSRRTLDISLTKYKGGVITYLEVAIAQSSSLAHEQTVVQLSAQRLAAIVSLIKALGAGWSADTGQVASSSAPK